MKRPLFSHVDVRVRDRARSIAFYDALLGPLGFARRGDPDNVWTSYYHVENVAPGPAEYEWFGFIEDPVVTPNSTRLAFIAFSRDEVDGAARVLRELAAGEVDGPNEDEGPGYYAVFFDDPDGHKLEVCCRSR